MLPPVKSSPGNATPGSSSATSTFFTPIVRKVTWERAQTRIIDKHTSRGRENER
jgi:hypothetical protein